MSRASNMFVLIWANLFFSVKGSIVGTGASAWGRQHCYDKGYCVTLSEQELTAEAGLCVVIPCSFTTADEFSPKHIVWYKCETSQHSCSDPEIIFHSNKNTDKKAQAGFEGRVSRLEPDVSQNNCSIIINDLKESDSGSYQLRVTGELNGKEDGFTFIPRVTVSVKGLNQKPTVMIPTLTEGQQATLTCTAPGLCSGSVPQITWTWRGAGGTESYITGNRTDFNTDNPKSFTQRHISTLTFNPSAEHHNTNVTCKVNFTGRKSTEETLTVHVNYMKEITISGVTTIREGDVLNLSCSVESFPPSLIVWSKLGSDTNLHNGTGSATIFIQNVKPDHSGQYICTVTYMNNTLKKDVNITVIYNRTHQIMGNTTVREGDVLNLTCSVDSFPPSLIVWSKLGSDTNLHSYSGSARLVIENVKPEHSGQYICAVTYMNNTLKKDINITVIYNRAAQIIGNTTVNEGDVLNLTCSAESFPPSVIVWSKLSSNTKLHNDTGSATLVIHNVTSEHSGQYICTVKHLDTAVTSYIDVTVTWHTKIQNGSGCVLQSEGLTCVCISEGFPLPNITWPLLTHHTEYSVITSVSNHTVNSTVSLTVKNHGDSTVECVSNNGNGEVRENLLINNNLSKKDEPSSGLRWQFLEIIIAFLIGAVLSSGVCFLAKKCYRKEMTSSGHLNDTFVMLTRPDDPLIYDSQGLQNNQTLNSNSETKEVEYATIDFSLLKTKPARTQESTKTEYAEIKRIIKKEQVDDDGDDGKMLEGEMKHCEPEKKEGEDEAVYSTVNDIIDDN
ncbi:basement membrane-specific heparan sulfate proteoglycan core protein-like isoform X2 [Simochromis diagramma]|uniref:basement membrane-specific heparan sulfate proteoglycan core protein-like isoform X2 n=1 Tax=Simochromis diagramma TaxID=43689 RepID=UPI001A7E6BFF|nr:basement membrane-specific heparan sulfate proteoglycan core protein-like isoform X2 [Simochromis diagramma]